MNRKSLISLLLAAVLAVTCFSFALADENWTCPSCGHENPGRANFCGSCRQPKPTTQVVVSTETNAWVCQNCREICPDEDAFCIMCGQDRTGNEERALLIPQPERPEIRFPSVEFRNYETTFTTEQETRSVDYTPPVTGTYCIFVKDTMSGLSARFAVTDDLGSEVGYEYMANDGWMTVSLTGGKRYQISVRQSSGLGTVYWQIGEPRDWADLGASRVIYDSIHFRGEDNRYVLVPETSGYHHLYITQAQSGFSARFSIVDDLNAEVAYSYIGQDDGFGANLTAGKTYFIHSVQSSGWGDYRLVIGCPKKTTDIGENTYIGDDTSFRNQENIYQLTAVEDGEYTLELFKADSGLTVRAEILDQGGYSLNYTYLSQGDSFRTSLKAGATYTIVVKQSSAYGPYCLRVTH